jgi:hypothetical protein
MKLLQVNIGGVVCDGFDVVIEEPEYRNLPDVEMTVLKGSPASAGLFEMFKNALWWPYHMPGYDRCEARVVSCAHVEDGDRFQLRRRIKITK